MVILQLLVAGASAQPGPELPVPVVARPPTLPRATVRIDADSTVGMTAREANAADLTAGFGVGVSDQFELGAELLPIALAPDVTYESPSLYAAYGAQPSEGVQLTPMARVFMPLDPETIPMLDLNTELSLQTDRTLRFNVTPSAHFSFGMDEVEPAFAAPVSLVLQPDRRFFVSLDSGVSTDPVDPRYRAPRPGEVDRALFVPVGAALGTTVGRPRKALADLSAGVYWPQMGEFAGSSQAHTEDFTVIARVQTLIPTLPMSAGNRPTRRR